MVDKYELKYGKVDDRSIFDGEIVVPPHLKNNPLLNSSRHSARLHGGLLGSLTRSRTFLNLSTTNLSSSRDSIHGSVPDLSRSVPTTPNINHKLSSTENKLNDEQMNNGKESSSNGQLVIVGKRINDSNVEYRRKSEEGIIDNRVGKSGRVIATMQYVSSSSQHTRNSSDPNNIVVRSNSKKPPIAISSRQSMNRSMQMGSSTPSLIESSNLALGQKIKINRSFSKWGNIRGSNSFANDLNVNTLSTFTLPRVAIDHSNHRHSKVSLKDVPKDTHLGNNDSAA